MQTVYWLEQADADVPEFDGWMCKQELARLSQLPIPKRRRDWRLGRWTAKLAFACLSDWSSDFERLARIEVRAAKSGAPELFVDHVPVPLAISISHRNGLSACAITRSSVALGCDLEWIEPHGAPFVADYFTRSEQNFIQENGEANRNLLITLLWSAKESALKALHEGLRLDTRSVEITLRENSKKLRPIWNLLAVRNQNGAAYSGWWQSNANFVRTIITVPDCAAPVDITPSLSLPMVEAPREASCEPAERADILRESGCTPHRGR